MDIKKLRKEKGLTQAEVAKKIGVSMMAYQLWERGSMKPNDENFKKLREVLGVE